MDFKLLFGKVTEVTDEDKYVIRFDVENFLEDKPAYPFLGSNVDEILVGDEIVIMPIDLVFGTTYVYVKRKLGDFVGIKRKNLSIELTHEDIIIKTEKATISLNDSGEVSVESESVINVKSDDVVIDGAKVEITGGQLTTKGSPTPNPAGGPFCALKNCLFTGSPHQGDVVQGT